MTYASLRTSRKSLMSAVAMAAVMTGAASTAVIAQDAPAAKPAAKPAAAAAKPAAGNGSKTAWVKLCEKAPIVKRGEDGKETKEERSLCLTHHERLDGNTGMVLVSAAIREVDGQNSKSLMVMVPLGMALPPGLRAAIYTKEQWAQAAKNEKIDESALKPIDLKYSLCHPAGCTAETEATPEILEQMSTGGGIMILAMNAAAEPVGFPVPLDGYNEAASGAPIDNKQYAQARGQLMKQIRDRQQKMAEEFKAEQIKNLPMNAPGAPEVAPAPAAKPAQ
jgi:invasion protein IalB